MLWLFRLWSMNHQALYGGGAAVTNGILLEDNASFLLLEDNSSNLLLEA